MRNLEILESAVAHRLRFPYFAGVREKAFKEEVLKLPGLTAEEIEIARAYLEEHGTLLGLNASLMR